MVYMYQQSGQGPRHLEPRRAGIDQYTRAR
jgi:hypothetical protein